MKKYGWVLSLLLCIHVSFASGASEIISRIAPLAMNAKGDVLCKSLLSKNVNGSRYVTDVDVSLCLVKDGEILNLEIIDQFKPSPGIDHYEEDYSGYFDIWDRYRAIEFSDNEPLLADYYTQYLTQGFTALALDEYALEPHFSVNKFNEERGVRYQDLKQVVLKSEELLGNGLPRISEIFDAEAILKTVKLQYQISNQLWLEMDDCPQEYATTECADDNPLDEGIYVMYYISPLYDSYKANGVFGNDNPDPFGYEMQRVNSIIFLPEEDREMDQKIDQETDEKELVKEK